MKDKVLIIFGGKSVESDISIITALQVMQNLPKEYDFLPVYIDATGKWWTGDNLNCANTYENFNKCAKNKKQVTLITGENVLLQKKHKKFVFFEKVDVVLNCCHGRVGEDGYLKGLFKCSDISNTSSNVTSCALCMDKCFMKDIFKANNIPTPEYFVVKKGEVNLHKKLTFPVVVKPANLGSSIGISVCYKKEDLDNALQLAFAFDNKVLIENLVQNLKEYNCACFKYKNKYFLSSVNEVVNKSGIYSFEDKYLKADNKSREAEKILSKKIKDLTEKIYTLFDCDGVVRVDYLLDSQTGELYVNEINSIPGSLAFYLFKDIKFSDLISSLIEQAKLNKSQDQKLIVCYKSDAIKLFSSIKMVKK